MRFYGMSYWDCLNTPIKAFWSLFANINRISAEEDLRSFQGLVASQSQSADAVQRHADALQRQIGTVFVEEAVLDSKGLRELKHLGALR